MASRANKTKINEKAKVIIKEKIMARLAGVDLPRNKRMIIALTYIFGIGPARSAKILAATGISPDLRTDDLTDDDIKKLRDEISHYTIEGDLKREESADLEEQTNRQGFVENDAYIAFKKAILHVVGLVETLRQTDKKKLKEIYGPTPKSEPVMSLLGEAQRYVDEKVLDSEVKTEIKKYLVKIEHDYKLVTDNLLKAAGAGLNMSVVIHEIEKIIYEVDKVLKAEKASGRALKLVQHLSSLIDGYADLIRRSEQTNESIVNIVNQALFNTEYRLHTHAITPVKKYLENSTIKGLRCKVARNLLIGAIMNLIDNSIYWLDQKAFKKLEEKEFYTKKIFIDVVADDAFIHIVVADNGTGILLPTEDITEPFVTGKKNGAGMGLGLHIASEVLNAQGGKLSFPDAGDFEIPSEFEQGAIVVLSLKK